MPQDYFDKYRQPATPTQTTPTGGDFFDQYRQAAETSSKDTHSFWDTPLGRMVGPTADMVNPINVIKGLGSLASYGWEHKQDIAADPNKALGNAAIGLAKGVLSPFADATKKRQQGDYPGMIGSDVAGILGILGPSELSALWKGAGKLTGFDNAANKLAEYGVDPSASLRKAFPKTNFGETAINEGSTGLTDKLTSVESKLQSRVAGMDNMGLRIDPYQNAQDIYDWTSEMGNFPGSGALRKEREAAGRELVDKYKDNWSMTTRSRTGVVKPVTTRIPIKPSEALNESRGTADLASWAKDRTGVTTASGVEPIWNQGNAIVNKDKVSNLATGAGLPDTADLVTQERDILALRAALENRTGGSYFAKRMGAHALGSGLMGGLGYASTGSPAVGAATAVIFEAMSNPHIAVKTAQGINNVAKSIVSPMGQFGLMQLANQGDEPYTITKIR